MHSAAHKPMSLWAAFAQSENFCQFAALVLTLAAFLFALTLLIAVHEYGHYRMAVAFGVPVLVFSIGLVTPFIAGAPKIRSQVKAPNFELALCPWVVLFRC